MDKYTNNIPASLRHVVRLHVFITRIDTLRSIRIKWERQILDS